LGEMSQVRYKTYGAVLCRQSSHAWHISSHLCQMRRGGR
jgi:hypothetical protein